MNRIERSISNIKSNVEVGNVGSAAVKIVDKAYVVGRNTIKEVVSTVGDTAIANDIKSISSGIFSGLSKARRFFTEDVSSK